MGLSASQARLLSITQRINNNELESEMISNAKIQLAARNTIASENYINALDGTKLEYISYDDSGTQEKVNLTFNSINQYTPLKNQYALFNNENQIYVSSTDAANFENSDNLYEFLECYGLFDRGRDEYNEKMQEYKDQMDEYNKEKDEYDKALAEYNKEMQDYTTELNEYNEKLKEYEKEYQQYLKDYARYEELKNLPKLYDAFLTAATTGSQAFHYSAAKGGDSGCLLHVLNNLLKNSSGTANPPYTTSAGSQVTALWEDIYQIPALYNVGQNMTTNEDAYVCDGIDVGTDGTENLYEKARKNGEPITDLIKLASDFIEIDKGGGNYSYEKKSLYQKTIDMYYLILNSTEMRSGAGSLNLWSLSDVGASVGTVVENFVEGDMKGLNPEEPEEPTPPEPFTEVPPTMEIAAPQEPEMPEYTDKIYDKPLAQWYTNLWYIMDGSTTSDELYSVYDEQAEFDYFTVPDAPKTSTEDSNNYVVISDDLAGNQEWLQFAINNGLVTLSQATLKNDTNSTNIRWEGIEYSSTSDIYESQDETKIAKAEAEYQKTLTEIQAEDKQLDIEIKKLDTEHSALEKELESIKGVMQKNTERSFSAFS